MLFFHGYLPFSGLGVKKLALALDSESEDVKYYSFPKLKGAGGCELLRTTSSHRLEKISIPPDGYTSLGKSNGKSDAPEHLKGRNSCHYIHIIVNEIERQEGVSQIYVAIRP